MTQAIEVKDLTKKFDEFLAVDHISFDVRLGEVFGFLGPNGAGKTTTTRMLTGISTPTEGIARVMGYDIQTEAFQAKEQIGVVTDLSNVYNELTAWDNLIFTGKLYGVSKDRRVERARELLEMFGLLEVKDKNVSEFSGGMKRRLTIAMALVNDAKTLFLDEPTTALDVQSVRIIRDLIRQLNADGTTIFLTTHNMEEANELCDRVAIINQGRIGVIGTPERLKQTIERVHSLEVVFAKQRSSLIENLRELETVHDIKKMGDKIRLYTLDPASALSDLFDFANKRDERILSVNTLSPSLEDVFLELTGEKIVKRPKRGKKGSKMKEEGRREPK
ncbi:MAG: ATP-binding cassette domain-containing protein [Candidatus Thorarchaeota archaeon]